MGLRLGEPASIGIGGDGDVVVVVVVVESRGGSEEVVR